MGSGVPPVTICSASMRANNGPSVKPVEPTTIVDSPAPADSPSDRGDVVGEAITPDQVRRSRTSASAGTTSTATAALPAALSQVVA